MLNIICLMGFPFGFFLGFITNEIMEGNWAFLGQLGDFIGGIFGTIISAIAALYAYKIYVSQKNLLKEQMFESRFYVLLTSLLSSFENLTSHYSGLTGRKLFNKYSEDLKSKIEISLKHNVDTNRIESEKNSVIQYFNKNSSELGLFIEQCVMILKLIDKEDLAVEKKKFLAEQLYSYLAVAERECLLFCQIGDEDLRFLLKKYPITKVGSDYLELVRKCLIKDF